MNRFFSILTLSLIYLIESLSFSIAKNSKNTLFTKQIYIFIDKWLFHLNRSGSHSHGPKTVIFYSLSLILFRSHPHFSPFTLINRMAYNEDLNQLHSSSVPLCAYVQLLLYFVWYHNRPHHGTYNCLEKWILTPNSTPATLQNLLN